MANAIKQWEKTDSTQFVNKINENTFEYVQALSHNDEVFVIYHAIVDITDYEEKDILEYIESYYDSIEKVQELYGEEYKQILCECIFESMNDNHYLSSLNVKEVVDTMKDDFNIIINVEDLTDEEIEKEFRVHEDYKAESVAEELKEQGLTESVLFNELENTITVKVVQKNFNNVCNFISEYGFIVE